MQEGLIFGEERMVTTHPSLPQVIPPRPVVGDDIFFERLSSKVTPRLMEAIGAKWEPEKLAEAEKIIAKILRANEDGFARVLDLKEQFKWDAVNEACVWVLKGTHHEYDNVLEELEREWTMRYGVRFPAKDGDRISFRTSPGHPILSGVVHSVFKGRSAGFVVWSPVKGKPMTYRVTAEQIIGSPEGAGSAGLTFNLLKQRLEDGTMGLPQADPIVA